MMKVYPSFQGWPKRYHQAEVDVRQYSLVLKVAWKAK